MKKKLLPFAASVFFIFQAFGQVGVGTETPTELLDIDGTLRIRNLPVNGSTNAIFTTGENTAAEAPTETFIATKTVVLDANGVLGAVPGLPSSSNTVSWTSIGSDFPFATNPDHADAMRFSFGPLSVSFFRESGSGFEFHIKSSYADS